MIFREQILQV